MLRYLLQSRSSINIRSVNVYKIESRLFPATAGSVNGVKGGRDVSGSHRVCRVSPVKCYYHVAERFRRMSKLATQPPSVFVINSVRKERERGGGEDEDRGSSSERPSATSKMACQAYALLMS